MDVEYGAVRHRPTVGDVDRDELDSLGLIRRRRRLGQRRCCASRRCQDDDPAAADSRLILDELVRMGHRIGQCAELITRLERVERAANCLEVVGRFTEWHQHFRARHCERCLSVTAEIVEDLPSSQPRAVEQRLAVECVLHRIRRVHDEDGRARRAGDGRRRIPDVADVGLGEGKSEETEQQAAYEHQQELLHAEAPRGLLVRPKDELEGGESNELRAPPVDQVNERRNRRREQAEEDRRGKEVHFSRGAPIRGRRARRRGAHG